MDLLTSWKLFEQTEDFRKLSYTEQMKSRDAFLKKYFETEGSSMTPDQKTQAYNTFVFSPPKMGNPAHDAEALRIYQEQITPNLSTIANPPDTTKSLEYQDMWKKNYLEYRNMYPNATEEEIVKKTEELLAPYKSAPANKASENLDKLFAEGGFTSGIGLLSNAFAAGQEGAAKLDPNSSLAQSLRASADQTQLYASEDFRKLKDYTSQQLALINSPYVVQGSLETAYDFGKMGAQVVTSLPLMAVTGPIEAGAKAGLTKVLGTAALNPWVSKLAVNLAPEVLRATVEASYFTASDYMERLNSGLAPTNGEEFASDLGYIGKTLGEYAVFDYVLGLGTSVLAPAALAGGTMAVKGLANINISNPAMKKFAESVSIEDAITGYAALSPNLKATLPGYIQAAMESQIDITNYIKFGKANGIDINIDPVKAGRLNSQLLGMSNVMDNAGVYNLRNIGEPDNMVKQINSTSGLFQALADKYQQKVSLMLKDYPGKSGADHVSQVIDHWKSSYPDMSIISTKMESIDNIYNPVRKSLAETGKAPAIVRKDFPDLAKRKTIYPEELAILESSSESKILRFNSAPSEGYKGFNYGTVLGQSDVNGKYIFPAQKIATVDELMAEKANLENLAKQGLIERKGLASPATFDDLANTNLMRKGYDAIDNGDGTYTILYANKAKQLDNTANVGVKVANPQKLVYATKGENPSLKVNNKFEFSSYVREQYSQTFKMKDLSKNDNLLVNAINAISAKPNQPALKNITENLLQAKTGQHFNVQIKTTKNPAGQVFSQKGDGVITLFVPEKTLTMADRANFVKTYYKTLSDITPGGGAKAFALPTNLDHTLANINQGFNIPLKNAKAKLNWLKDSIERNFSGTIEQTDKGLTVKLDGETLTFSNIDDAITYVTKNTISDETLNAAMKADGYKVQKVGEDWVVMSGGKSNRKVAVGRNLNELADKLGYTPEKMDIRMSPKETFVFADDSFEVKVENGKLYGKLGETQQFLNQFTDYSKIGNAESIEIKPNGKIITKNPKAIIVQSNILQHEFHLTSPTEAKDLINRIDEGQLRVSELEQIAHDKGIFLWNDGPTFYTNVGGNIKTFNNTDDLYQHLSTIPTPTGARELLDPKVMEILDPIIAKTGVGYDWLQKQPKLQVPQAYIGNLLETIGPIKTVESLFTPRDAWLMEAFEKIGSPEGARYLQSINNANVAGKAQAGLVQRKIDPIFKEGKKFIPATRREGIFEYMRLQEMAKGNSEAAALVRAELPKLERKIIDTYKLTTADITTRIADIRTVFGNTPVEGLFVSGGTDAYKFLFDYLPRLKVQGMQKNFFSTDIDGVKKLIDSSGIVDNKAITELQSFFQHTRTAEVAMMATEKDIYKLLTYYNVKASKAQFLNPVLKDLGQFRDLIWNPKNIDATGKAPPALMYQKLNEYIENVTGLHSNKATEGLKKGIYNFLTSVRVPKEKAFKLAQASLDNFFSVSYFTGMAFKPALVIRNTLQPYQTAAQFVGTGNVSKAFQEFVSTNMDNQILRAEKLGIISDRTPYLQNFNTGPTITNRAVDVGMAGFKNSDTASRIITMRASDFQFDQGLKAMKYNPTNPKFYTDPLSWKGFFQYTNGNMLDRGASEQILGLLQKGQIDVAKDLYAKEMVRQTMFDYSSWNVPIGRSFLGKLFGQYQSYAFSYIQNFRRMTSGFTNNALTRKVGQVVQSDIDKVLQPTFSQSASAFTSFLINAVALQKSFEIFRARGDNFAPFAPLYFNGGPWFKLAAELAALTGQLTNANPQLRNELLDDITKQISPYQTKSYGNELRSGWFYAGYPTQWVGSAQYRMITNYFKHLDNGDPQAAYLSLSGFSVLPDDQLGRIPVPALPLSDSLITDNFPSHVQQALAVEGQGY